MLEWMVYLIKGSSRVPMNGGTSYTSRGAENQARRGVERSVEAKFFGPYDGIEFVIDSNTEYMGSAEEFMGRTALSRMSY